MAKNKKRQNHEVSKKQQPIVIGQESEMSMNQNEPTSEEPTKALAQSTQQNKPKSAKKTKMSFMEKILKGLGYIKKPKFEDRYISRIAVEKNYISRENIEANYMLKSEVELSYISSEVVKTDYMPIADVAKSYISLVNLQADFMLKSKVEGAYISKEYVNKHYVSKSIISTLMGKLADILDMGKDFANLSLEEKFARIKERVERLKTTVGISTVGVGTPREDATGKKELVAENARLKADLEVVKNNLNEAHASAERDLEKLHELNDKLAAAESKANEIKRQKEEAEHRASSAESKIKDAEDKASAAQETVQKAEAEARTARDELANSEVGKLNITIGELNTQLEETKRDYADAYRALDEAKAKISNLEIDIENKTSDIEDKGRQIATMIAEVEDAKKLEENLNMQLQKMEIEIEQLKKQGEIDRTEIESKTTELAEATDSIAKQREEISEKESTISNLEKECADKSAEISKLNGGINALEEEKLKLSEEISEKQFIISNLEKESADKSTEISMLNDNIIALEGEKQKLNEEKTAADAATKVKANFIKSERDNYADNMMKIVDKLCAATKEDFIISCDEESERQCKTLAEKVWRPLIDFKDELVSADTAEAETVDEFMEGCHKVIKAHLDEPSELTRIAQWYAYSLVPFMGDTERCEGIRVNRPKMKEIYALASELLSMVGMRFDLPILYVENLEDGSDYDNMTGQRQLNIEYMCPTARNHKEKIDISDTESVIIDVVEVGYIDNRGNQKKITSYNINIFKDDKEIITFSKCCDMSDANINPTGMHSPSTRI